MRVSKFVDVVLYTAFFGSAIYLLSNAPAAHADQAKIDRAAERCVVLADYAQDVAEMRDLGFSLNDVKETNAEQYRGNILDAHNITAEITYRNRGLPPKEIRKGLLEGCLYGVANHAQEKGFE